MASAFLIRALALYLPIAITILLWVCRRPDRRQATAALLAGAWCIPSLLMVNLVAPAQSWWHFEARGGLFLGIPVDLFLGWVVLWGPLQVLALCRTRLGIAVVSLALIDLILMTLAKPVVQLDHIWLVGEAASILVCLTPAMILARWTEADIRVVWRAVLQAICFVGLTVGVIPAAVLSLTGGSWQPFLTRPFWLNSLGLQLFVLPAMVGLSAVQEFAVRGHGTPLPYDPPVQLVRTGIYRYIANPMQASVALTFIVLAALLQSWWLAAAGIIAFAYGAGIAGWNEATDMKVRYGRAWEEYRACVRRWIPRWKPASEPAATIYVAGGCDMCRGVGRWIAQRRPVSLTIKAAELHPSRTLSRIAYECEGYIDEGVAAFARALEHVNVGWALVGCAMRLPVVRPFLQVLVDSCGGGPRRIERLQIENCKLE